MTGTQPAAIHLKDYRAPQFLVDSTELRFELFDDYTLVSSKLQVRRNGAHAEPLMLHGQDLALLALAVDGRALGVEEYQVGPEHLTLYQVPDAFELHCQVRIEPHKNTALEGLYRSHKMYCTQCEAEGFRKITYYLDRPDVLSVFTTEIVADAERYPVLLSNGNPVAQSREADGRHSRKWHDPFPKPAYLFALVAGDLAKVEDSYVTGSGRKVLLQIYVEPKDLDKCDHAMNALKNAMAWDERVYGREYDLDLYMIVAVDDFNMGAMENKGLNIFNTACVLAHPDTTTDAGFQRVEGVVAHEYFHNWSGNRVTCRDWFQLSLKEGFTVFRDEEFSADMGSRTVKRVEDVQLLRTLQFAEDAGPMAHPVQPASFIEISNFYTLTVYEKGAEVVRMIHTLLGPELFRRGADLYFERHDGQAVTIEDFVQAMADVSGRDFAQFMRWYRQAGTPRLQVRDQYDESTRQYRLHITQSSPSTPEAHARDKQPLHIPVAIGLLGEAGALALHLAEDDTQKLPQTGDNTHRVLELTEPQQTFVFCDVPERPVPALLRGFSAPVKLDYPYADADLLRILTRDDDGFCRWDACQQLGIRAIQGEQREMSRLQLQNGFAQLIADDALDPAMVSLMLELPSEAYLGEQQQVVDVDANHRERRKALLSLAHALEPQWLQLYERCQRALQGLGRDVSARSIALRSLKNRALQYLMQLPKTEYWSLCQQQFEHGENMSDVFSALVALVHSDFVDLADVRRQVLEQFYQRWQGEALVVNQWLSAQAADPSAGALQRVKTLVDSAVFDIKNPNKVRSVIGVFAQQNMVHFHATDGAGYAFLADQIVRLNRQNPQIAARLLTPLSKWRRYDERRQALMREQLQRIAASDNLSKDVFEIVHKSLVDLAD